MKKLDDLIRRCRKEITDVILEEKAAGTYPKDAYIEVDTKDGVIEICVSPIYGKKVIVYHDESERRSDNIAKAIDEGIPDYFDDDVQLEERIDGVDPGFSSFQDYIDYKYN